jgi:molybdopterin/thiamine biosynthesis adenylyltransferase
MSKHQRQSFLGQDSEKTLRSLRIAIVGLGGGGSHVAQQSAHIGVGDIRLFDHDRVEDTNLNRLIGATEDDIKQKTLKVDVAKRLIHGIDSKIKAVSFATQWQKAATYLHDVDVIFGCVDSFIERRQLEVLARRYLIPYIDIGMDVHEVEEYYVIGGQVFLSMPGQPCMKCLGLVTDESVAQEAARYGAAGDRAQVVWPNGVLASLAVGVLMQLVTPWCRDHRESLLLEYDGNSQTVAHSGKSDLLDHIRCPHFSSPQDLGDPFIE